MSILDTNLVAASTTPVSSPATSAPPASGTGPAVLTANQTIAALIIVAVALLAVGAVIVYARTHTGQHAQGAKSPSMDPSASVVRSWIAVSLIVGLVLLSVITFAINDEVLRSTLIGGLTASVGSAIAYYFSTKAADQARQDILAATGTEVVPDLHGKSENDAAATLGKTSLKLEVDPTSSTAANATVSSQYPTAGTTVATGTTVKITLA
jgi:Mn2+/Fe2+ NRAMP family transporter